MVCFFGLINVNRKINDVNLLHFKLYWNTQLAIKAKKVGMTGFEPATPRTPCVCATRLRHIPYFVGKNLSGWQDSNLRPPAPKAGAMTGLRYTPLDGLQI